MAVVASILIATTAIANSPYISEVLDYSPAPGQFINTLPSLQNGETPADAATRTLKGKASGGMICLGAFGGYAVFRFDHPVANVAGAYDFRIYGNAPLSGSSEPGIVSVSIDRNKNGVADDEWYELAGSNYGLSTTLRNYTVTYHRPSEDTPATPDPNSSAVVNMYYIRWTDNLGNEGWVQRNSFHMQHYWPKWHDADETITFSGSRLASNRIDKNGDGSYYILENLPWGYVDNQSNTVDPGFKIDWAVDHNGTPIHLPYVDFIKVHTAVQENNGWLGESSTEISGAEDLHPDAAIENSSLETISSQPIRIISVRKQTLHLQSNLSTRCSILNLSGNKILPDRHLTEGDNYLDLNNLQAGIYLLFTPEQTIKFIIE